MSERNHAKLLLIAALGALVAAPLAKADPNSYRAVEGWAKLPQGRSFGQVINVRIAPDGKNIWVFERCGSNTCAGSSLDPILEFDPAGNLIKSFGGGLFVFPHGLFIDRDGNVWATDAAEKDGKGNQVFKFSPDGKVLMTLGKAGVAGADHDTFDKPTDAVVAANGDIFVADGHGNSRIVKFTADGKYIKEWGKKGNGPSEFNVPHSLALDSAGRLFVADRSNSRIQIFDPDGKFLAAWRQFGRPSGLYIDKNDRLYATDSESGPVQNPGYKRGIRIGSVKDGSVIAFIPDNSPLPEKTAGPGSGTGAEGVAADAAGNVYGGATTERRLMRYEPQ
jgi:sugar lactone lactonase YvrE